MQQTSSLRYSRHQYSGPKKNRKHVRAQLKYYHGEGVSRENIWRKKPKNNNTENQPSISSYSARTFQDRRKLKLAELTDDELRNAALRTGGLSSSSDVPNDSEAKSTTKENKDQDLCKQIKNSLKRLRQQETGEAESDDENKEESPLLNLEVFPDEAEHPGETKENLDTEKDKEESDSEFHDESQTQELSPTKSEIEKQQIKPLKRNPRRKVVIEKEIKKSLIDARNAPALEKVYVNATKKSEKQETKQGKDTKRARLETSEIPSHFDHKEQLYEFGKYVAEQMMCFDEKDVRLAQAEIKEVLSKFRLKYKIMNCLSKPSNGEAEADTDRHLTAVTQKKSAGRAVTKSKPGVHSTGRPVTQTGSQINPTGNLVTQSGLPQRVSVVPSLNELGMLNMNSSSAMTPLGFIIMPTMNTPRFHITTQRMDTSGSIVTQLLQGNSIGSSLIQPGTSRVISTGTSGIQSGPSHVISTGTSGIQPGSSHVISTGTSGIQPGSSHVISTGTAGIQPGPSNVISMGTSGIQPGPSHVISTGTSGIQPGSSHVISSGTPLIQSGPLRVISTGTSGIQPGPSHVISMGIPVTQPGSSHLSSAETSDTQPVQAYSVEATVEKPMFSQVNIVESSVTPAGNSETPMPPVPESHFVGYIPCSGSPETVIVKCETESDEET